MNARNLLDDYPDLLEKVREWDCSYTEAVQRIEAERRPGTLARWFK